MLFLFSHNALLASIVFLTSAASSCYGDVLNKRSATSLHSLPNSTYISPTKSISNGSAAVSTKIKSSSESPFATPVAVLSSATIATNDTSPITQAPIWGNQTIPINTCSTLSEGVTVWNPCSVFAGTVHLSYFPENYGNCSRCATEYYDPALSVTLTSPSVYLVVNTLYGYNTCGPLGPNYVSHAFAMALSDVSTLPPYADASATSRAPARQLTLSDLENCANYTATSTSGVLTESHPVSNDYNRCNPRLWVPMEFKRVGYPYWMHCGNRNFGVGVFDPPGAVPTADSLFVSTIPVQYTSTYDSPTVAATPVPEQASSTSAPIPSTTLESNTQSSDAVFLQSPTPSLTTSPLTAAKSSPTPTAIATIANQVISAAPGDTSVVINGQAVTSGGEAVTLAGSNNVATLGSEGLIVQYPSGIVSTFTIPSPIQALPAAATVAGIAVTAAAGASDIVIGSQTATLGGDVVALANGDVVSVGSSGVVVQMPGGGVSTVTLATSIETAEGAVVTSAERVAGAIASSATTSTNLGGDAKAAGATNSSGAAASSKVLIASSSGSVMKVFSLVWLCSGALGALFWI